jgi:hypothetical protein
MKQLDHVGGNFYMTEDGWLFNTVTQSFFHSDSIPATMKHAKSVGDFPLYMTPSEFPTKEGMKFVTIDYCESYFYSKSGKTKFAKFINFEYVSDGYFGKKEYAYAFELHQVYAFFFEVNDNYAYNLKLIKHVKINKDVKDTLEKDDRQRLDRDIRTARREADNGDANISKGRERKGSGSDGGVQGSLF